MNDIFGGRVDGAIPHLPRREMPASRFLNQLPGKAREALVEKCENVTLGFEQVLVQPGGELAYVYFPINCFISQVMVNGGAPIEVALTGDEGFFGLAVALGVPRSPVLATVQGAGSALRMTAAAFIAEMREVPALQKLILRYAHVCLAQSAVHISCANNHSVEQRVARWFLMIADRARSTSFRVTQRLLAYMIGVRRVGVTNAASRLQTRGLVRYTRGSVEVVDIEGLRAVACPCYQHDLDTYAEAMGFAPALDPAAVVAAAPPVKASRLHLA